jgi:hypothetical protein
MGIVATTRLPVLAVPTRIQSVELGNCIRRQALLQGSEGDSGPLCVEPE